MEFCKKAIVALPFALFVFVALATASTQTACSSKTCSQAEEEACTSTYTACTQTAAMTADKVACQKCVDDYCACYDKCGNKCDKSKLSAACI